MNYKIIEKDGSKGIADKYDNIIIPYEYKYINLSYFEKNELIIVCKDYLWGLINIKGEIIIPYKYRYISLYYFKENGLIEVINKNNLYGIINIKNEVIIPCKYKEIVFDYKKPELIRVDNSAILTEYFKFSYYFIKNDKIILYNKKKIYGI